LRSKATSLYFSRNEKLSRNNKRLLYSDGRNCPEASLDTALNFYRLSQSKKLLIKKRE